MASLWLLILQYSAFSQFGFWEENQNYYLDTGINVTCLPLTSAYQSICTGTTCSTKFKFLNQKGYSEIIYTLNIYYTDTPRITFSENGNKIQEQYLKQKWNLNTFQYCNSNYEVQYFKIFSSQTLNVNTLTFSITSDIPSKFIITTLKIYVHRCHKYCEICNPENQCIQCFPNFQLQDSHCKCQVQTPFLYQDQCIHKCPNGFYTSFFYCNPYNQLENIIFDGQANQFTFIKDFNTTNRVTSFMENGKQFAGLFFQNEAVIYSLPQPLETVTNLYLTIEIFIFNQDQPLLFSVKFDDYVYYQNSFTLNIYPNKFFVFESCSILGNSNCTKILYNNYIKQINKLKDIILYFNIPLQNSQTSWAISSFKLDKIETIPKAPCYKKLYYDECVQDCPPTSKQIGEVCQNITSEYPFAEIFLKGFTKDPQLEDLLPDKQKFLQLCNSNKICIYPFYKNQYIFGGHRKWSNQFYSQELNFQDKSHYKVKIYMKILLIDPLNDLDTLSIFIDDKHYSISKTHPNSTCINNIGSGACVKQEDVGTVATDYIIQIEIEIDHRTNSLNLGFRCNNNSLDFYCSFYDFIVLLAKCPFNCKKCTSSTNCIFEPGIALQDISYNSCPEYYYYYDGNCEPCSKFCKQCNQLKCLTCNENYEMIGESCICKYNRVIAQFTDCKDNCGFSCSVCLNNQKLSSFTKSSHNSTCHQCYIQEKKVLSGLECVCLDGYYMDQSTFFYQCKECNLTCGTCNEGQNCLSCNHEQNREISDNMCICKQGYYQIDNDNLICKQCNPNCKTCTNSTDQCTSCFSDQFRNVIQYVKPVIASMLVQDAILLNLENQIIIINNVNVQKIIMKMKIMHAFNVTILVVNVIIVTILILVLNVLKQE